MYTFHVRKYEGEVFRDHVSGLHADLGGDKVHGREVGRGELADVDGGEDDDVGHEVVHVLVQEGLVGCRVARLGKIGNCLMFILYNLENNIFPEYLVMNKSENQT